LAHWEKPVEAPIDEPIPVAPGGTAVPPADVVVPPAEAVVPPAEVTASTGGLAPARGPGLYWWLTIGLIVTDQITKALVRQAVPLYDARPVISGFVDFVHVRNEGVAFGLLNTLDLRNKWVLTTALATAALAGIAYYARHIRQEERFARIGLSMVLGGAIGNLIDRVYAGYVLDFVDVYWRDWHFWAFNVADASISIGAVLVFVDLLLVKRHASHPV
jgi:signal peptidase II